MKRLVLILIVLFTAATLLAGDGKSCGIKKSGKSVSLTGTIADGGEGKTLFRVADGKTFTVCEKSKADVAALGANGAKLRVTGKVMSCDDSEGQELVVETAKKI
jgi:hypothetical protein